MKEIVEESSKHINNNHIQNDKSKEKKTKNLIQFYKNEISEQEIQYLIQLKELCASKQLEYRFDLYNDYIILRLLRSKKYNIQETFKLFQEYINFTTKYQAFNLDKVQFPNFDKIRLFYPHGFHKTTKEGNPVFIQNLGECKISDINRILPEPLLTQYILYKINEVEKIIFPSCSEKFDKKINQIYCVVDLLGLTTSLMNKQIVEFINKLIKVCSIYYPGIMESLIFVNTSLVFRGIWTPCKYFYESETREKIKLLGFDYKEELLKSIELENLPKFFGGMCNCSPYGCLYSNIGPWNEPESKGDKRRKTNYLEKLNNIKKEKKDDEDDDDIINDD